jgi:hypothetical protein
VRFTARSPRQQSSIEIQSPGSRQIFAIRVAHEQAPAFRIPRRWIMRELAAGSWFQVVIQPCGRPPRPNPLERQVNANRGHIDGIQIASGNKALVAADKATPHRPRNHAAVKQPNDTAEPAFVPAPGAGWRKACGACLPPPLRKSEAVPFRRGPGKWMFGAPDR